MNRSTFDPTTKKAALYSGLLHLFALLFLMLGVIFSNLFARKEEPHIFEMVALPESAFTEEMTFEPIQAPTVDIPEPEPIELPEPPPPEPEPEPIQETPPPPDPEPQPVIRETPPPPVPVEQPKPEPKPERKLITLDQYQKEHGEIKTPDAAEIERARPKPKPRQAIDTSKIEKQIRDAVASVPEMSITTPTTTVDTDAMKQWRSILAGLLDAKWKRIETKGTAGRSVRVSFYVSVGGGISSVRVLVSSGIPQLDSQAIQTVQSLGNITPPPSGKGETVTVLLKVE